MINCNASAWFILERVACACILTDKSGVEMAVGDSIEKVIEVGPWGFEFWMFVE